MTIKTNRIITGISFVILLCLRSCATQNIQSPSLKHVNVPTFDPVITIPIQNLPPDVTPLELVYIPAGSFLMGSPETEIERNQDEGPQHRVTLTRPFYLGKYEITQAQWLAIMGGPNPASDGERAVVHSSKGVGPDYPVYYVSWLECQEFTQRLSELFHERFRLPTEAEWEYACRAGTTTRYSYGDVLSPPPPDGSAHPVHNQNMWYGMNAIDANRPVGLKLPNPWGLYDMHGNVEEWCLDVYLYYKNEEQENPLIDQQNLRHRVFRGGNWGYTAEQARSAARDMTGDVNWGCGVGFRVLMEIQEENKTSK